MASGEWRVKKSPERSLANGAKRGRGPRCVSEARERTVHHRGHREHRGRSGEWGVASEKDVAAKAATHKASARTLEERSFDKHTTSRCGEPARMPALQRCSARRDIRNESGSKAPALQEPPTRPAPQVQRHARTSGLHDEPGAAGITVAVGGKTQRLRCFAPTARSA